MDGVADDLAAATVVSSGAEVAGQDDASDGVTGESEAVPRRAADRPTAQEVWGLAHLLLYYLVDQDEPGKHGVSR